MQTLKYERGIFPFAFITAFFRITSHFPGFLKLLKNYAWGRERVREKETFWEGREMPLLSGQALLLGVWPWKRTPFSETSNGSHIGFHYYAVICMHPFVSFPVNNAHTAPLPSFSNWSLKVTLIFYWRLKFHLQAPSGGRNNCRVKVRWPLPKPAFAHKNLGLCVYTDGRQWLVAVEAATAPAFSFPASSAHRQGFPPAFRAKPSQPSDQGPAICDWGRFTAGANPHCQPRLFSISASSLHKSTPPPLENTNNLPLSFSLFFSLAQNKANISCRRAKKPFSAI